jgi:hypothetical protein
VRQQTHGHRKGFVPARDNLVKAALIRAVVPGRQFELTPTILRHDIQWLKDAVAGFVNKTNVDVT